jgi:hypothetical protein
MGDYHDGCWVSIRLLVRGIPMRAFKLMKQIVHWKGLQGLTTYLLRVFLRALTSSRASNRSYTLITSWSKVPYPLLFGPPDNAVGLGKCNGLRHEGAMLGIAAEG